ncbi:MAG: RDD family protein [Saprospiraceae bacterium]
MNSLEQDLFDHPIQQYHEASKGKRFTNYVIDYLIYLGLITIISVVILLIDENNILFIEDDSFSRTATEYIVGAFLMTVYYTIIEFFLKGKSVGKFITKTRAVKQSGEPLTFEDILKRSACRMIPFDAFSYLGELKDGWHDSIPGAKVIDENLPFMFEKPALIEQGFQDNSPETFTSEAE